MTVIRRLVVVLGAFAIGVGVALWMLPDGPFSGRTAGSRTTGKALIGGPFSLIDQRGKRFTEKDLKGRYSLIFFGFTHCPDICPSSLQVMAAALDKLGARGEQIQPIFVTVDALRDTPEQLATYVEHFHPRLLGLTGSTEEVRGAAKAFRIYFAKVGGENGGSDYTMDHSSIMYLMDKQGEFLAHFNHGITADSLAEKIREVMP